MTQHTGEQVSFPEENISERLSNLKKSVNNFYSKENIMELDIEKFIENMNPEERAYVIDFIFRKLITVEELFTMYHTLINVVDLGNGGIDDSHLFMPYYMKLMEEIGEENITEVLGENHEIANISILSYEWTDWKYETNQKETSFTDYLWYRKDSKPHHTGTWTLEDVTGAIDIHEVIENTIESSLLHQAIRTAKTEVFTPMQKEKLEMYVTAFQEDLQLYPEEQPSEILERLVTSDEIQRLSKERIADLLKVTEDVLTFTTANTVQVQQGTQQIQITAEKNGKYSLTTPEGEKVFSKNNIRGLRENIAMYLSHSETDLAA